MKHIISSKDFNYQLSMEKAKDLEELSQETWKVLHDKGELFDIDEIEEHFPAYISTMFATPSVVVKFPTYKIDVYGVDDDEVNHLNRVEIVRNFLNELERVNEKVGCGVAINHMINLVTRKTWDELAVEIKCLDFGLDKNLELKDGIVDLLKSKGYRTGISIDTNYIYSRIEIFEDEKKFRIKEQPS
ncbi:hypothetical protein SAMN02910400_02350 [Lachnospiraceae bacterium C10]|nr:hypothetical protein SAMN02910400_02350 [Lachnospiraceae bacterium C10]